jgi:pyruvate/2-oxoglutarate dehydrogenase complex dihydrolipoamide dehydrogenase (E3) component
MPAVKARKDAVVKASNEGVVKWLKGTAGVAVIEGHARFEGPHTVRVGDLQLEAPQIFVNVGGRAAVPPIKGIDKVDYLDNVTMMEVDALPRHLVVIGGSYVGLEFAQMYRRFGAEVTVVEMAPVLIGLEDAEVSAAVKEILEAEGIAIRLAAKCVAVRTDPNGIAVGIDCNDEPKEVVGSHLLLATGRRPNTDDLGCDRAGIALDERGYIRVDDSLGPNVDGIYALGDVNAAVRSRIPRTTITRSSPRTRSMAIRGGQRPHSTYALFIDPPLAAPV